MNAIMQLMTNELPDFNMQILTTKCLNTAVTIMYLFLGDKDNRFSGLVNQCDSHVVSKRGSNARKNSREPFAQSPHNPTVVMHAFEKEVLNMKASTRLPERTLYYIMITDACLLNPDQKDERKRHIMFPGHVLVLEKNIHQTDNANGKPKVRYNLYQSYIDHYDLGGHIRLNKSLSLSTGRVLDLLKGLNTLYSVDRWNAECTAFWERLTHVKSPEFEGFEFANRSYFCFTQVKTTACVEKLRDFLRDRLARIPIDSPDVVYGDSELYTHLDVDVKPLTNSEMKKDIEYMLAKIDDRRRTHDA